MKFAEGIAAGLNGTVAYQAAYPKASEESARGNASRLITNDDIQEEITRLKQKVEDEFVFSRVEWLNSFLRIARKAEEAEDYSAARASLRELGLANKNWYEPEKVEVSIFTPEQRAVMDEIFPSSPSSRN